MFRGSRPEGQPASLRTIAEKAVDPVAMEGAVAYVPQAGVPADQQGATQVYHDQANENRALVPTARSDAADPRPFVVTKRG